MKIIAKLLICFFLFISFSCNKNESKMNQSETMEVKNSYLERVEPPNWWIGFKNNSLQLLVKRGQY